MIERIPNNADSENFNKKIVLGISIIDESKNCDQYTPHNDRQSRIVINTLSSLRPITDIMHYWCHVRRPVRRPVRLPARLHVRRPTRLQILCISVFHCYQNNTHIKNKQTHLIIMNTHNSSLYYV